MRQSSSGAVHSPQLLAISKTLFIVQEVHPQPVLLLTDLHCAIGAICNPRDNVIAWAVGKLINTLEDKGFVIAFQWIATYVGMLGNEKANRLAADEALQGLPLVRTPDNLRAIWKAVQQHILSLAFHFQTQKNSGITRGLLRTKQIFCCVCVVADKLFHQMCRRRSPLCCLYHTLETTSLLVFECPKYHQLQKCLSHAFVANQFSTYKVEQLVFLWGTQFGQRLLRLFLDLWDNGVMNQL